MGYLELYNYDQCAQYISSFLAYEELDPPDEFPSVIPSPSNVINWQKGDCFDLSIVLCSLLIGVGYDAYCVYGLAPREITTKNESLMDNPFENKGITLETPVAKPDENAKPNDFVISKKPPLESQFDKKLAEQKRLFEEERKYQAEHINDDEPDELGPDMYLGRRLHCWVLLMKGKRGVEENLFLEPSTGRIYPIKYNPYQSVDAVFNNKNFWINMKPGLEVKDVNFDEMNTSVNWEYVMLDTINKGVGGQKELEEGEKEEDYGEIKSPNFDNLRTATIKRDENDDFKFEEEPMIELGELDMPPPWPPKLYIDKENFLKLSPLGETQVFYKRSRIDNYAPYSQSDGLVQRITFYDDYKRLKVREIRYFYQHRSDKLSLRRRMPFEFKTIEEYEPGKAPQHWKKVMEIDRKLRIIEFYPNRNTDGLIRREERIGLKTIEFYEHRGDKVIYRSVRFDPNRKANNTKDCTFPDNHMGDVVVTKMTQKFEKDDKNPPNEQIQKMIIDLIKNKVMVYYHMNEGEISPAYKEYSRELLNFPKTESSSDKKADDPIAQQQNQKMMSMEKECIINVKTQETCAKDDEKGIREEKLVLEKTLYEKAREKHKENLKKKDEEAGKGVDTHDYLYPFLEKRKLLGKVLVFQDAVSIKTDVMSKLKERLLSRAEIIQKRLEKERMQLDQAETQMSRKGEHISKEDEKAFEEIIKEKSWKIGILEQRATRFEAMALQKYGEMDQKLNDDPRLAALKQQRN